jgi:hypothetical protein
MSIKTLLFTLVACFTLATTAELSNKVSKQVLVVVVPVFASLGNLPNKLLLRITFVFLLYGL